MDEDWKMLGFEPTGRATLEVPPHHHIDGRGLGAVHQNMMGKFVELIYLKGKIDDVFNMVDRCRARSMLSINEIGILTFSMQDVVVRMKRIMDECYMIHHLSKAGIQNDVPLPEKIKVTGYNWRKLPPGDEMYKKFPVLFETVQDMRNSFVHHATFSMTYSAVVTADENMHPILWAISIPDGRTTQPVAIGAYFESIVRSFSEFVTTYATQVTSDN